MPQVKKAIVPVGGLGTRFLPATKSLPKEMLPVASKPVVQHVFEEARESSIEQFIFVTGRNKNIITNHFDCMYELESILNEKDKKDALCKISDWLPEAGKISFIRQQRPLGLGHAIYCARDFISKDEAFAVLLPDDLFISRDGKLGITKSMIKAASISDSQNIIAAIEVEQEMTHMYGIMHPKNKNNTGDLFSIDSVVEKPKKTNSNLAIAGRYIFNYKIFDYLEKVHKDSNQEIQLTSAIQMMIEQEPDNIMGYYAKNIEKLDCGNPIGFLDANIRLSLMNQSTKKDTIKLLKKYQNYV